MIARKCANQRADIKKCSTASTSTATTNKFQIAPTIVGVFCLYTAHEQIDKSKPPPFIECKI